MFGFGDTNKVVKKRVAQKDPEIVPKNTLAASKKPRPPLPRLKAAPLIPVQVGEVKIPVRDNLNPFDPKSTPLGAGQRRPVFPGYRI